MDENKITAIRIYMAYGAVDIPATNIEENRMFDEVSVTKDGVTVAKFFTRNLVGYEIIREKSCNECSRAVEFGCMED